jgi:hypothetical protein
MLFMHETHRVIGRHASAFEDVYREEWMPTLAQGSDARLVWYLNHAMGSGPAYQVVTITALADGAACVTSRPGSMPNATRSPGSC